MAAEDRSTMSVAARMITGVATLAPAGEWPFRHLELHTADEVPAKLGRGGFIRTYFGRGRRVLLSDGSRWRLAAVSRSRWICPAVFNAAGEKVAVSGLLNGSVYGITTFDRGYSLTPYGKSTWRVRPNRWGLESDGERVATLTLRPRRIVAPVPVPTAVVLVAFTLMAHGIPGESDLGIPPVQWKVPRAR